MDDEKQRLDERILEIEALMSGTDFWADKAQAQTLVRELQDLKQKKEGVGQYDRGDAVVTIFAGAGGDDSEDFSRMLLEMYLKYIKNKGWGVAMIHENQNDRGGYRNISFEVNGKNAYGTLKNESGVHRLVRLSPFNSKQLRHTSFSMVEVIPKFTKNDAADIVIPDKDLKIEFSRSSGPGGQNVNKRETAVRVVHLPTNLAVHADGERSQEANREKAMDLLRAKLYKRLEDERIAREKNMYISKTTEIEWGNQIRSYVLHPYKLIKDHRTNLESTDTDAILEEGDLQAFIDAEKGL